MGMVTMDTLLVEETILWREVTYTARQVVILLPVLFTNITEMK
jgi:hypothetical protein